ncbi:hydroxyisourate hydrolase [Saccharomonospora cyanea]|uniref:5-hydroxyisourate hydrolase n=1 Tax=Saccharomonospora cyanea NA-134 TaxID=882082 RepID=H5XF57_9PSEU|nr:hydroxyisourate hydrolase [Saccharomonospora cyanea]EHR61467.1 hydroxyisourate hydrolase [Saccharomonospora cyanea NA-134]
MSAITTHVLDTALGRPATGVPVRLERLVVETDGTPRSDLLAVGTTNSDGRVPELGPDRVEAGTYQLVFDTETYFAATGQIGFFPRVRITFLVADPGQHHHVPVLLSPFAYSTYRGS